MGPWGSGLLWVLGGGRKIWIPGDLGPWEIPGGSPWLYGVPGTDPQGPQGNARPRSSVSSVVNEHHHCKVGAGT